MRLLTTTEAAEYLRLKERKLYELVAEGAIPCTKVTGKWLFPQAELDRWLSGACRGRRGCRSAEPMPIVGGSHDPLLEWALRESGSGLATLPEGSEAGLARFEQGGIVATAIHLHSLADEGDPNVDALRERGGFHDAVLIALRAARAGLPRGARQSARHRDNRRRRATARPLGGAPARGGRATAAALALHRARLVR